MSYLEEYLLTFDEFKAIMIKDINAYCEEIDSEDKKLEIVDI